MKREQIEALVRRVAYRKPIYDVGPPRPAPARFPYYEHRTLAEVDAEGLRINAK